MSTALAAPPAAPPAAHKTADVVLTILKYLLPVASTALAIWLHNQQTVSKIQQSVGLAEAGIEAAQSGQQ